MLDKEKGTITSELSRLRKENVIRDLEPQEAQQKYPLWYRENRRCLVLTDEFVTKCQSAYNPDVAEMQHDEAAKMQHPETNADEGLQNCSTDAAKMQPRAGDSESENEAKNAQNESKSAKTHHSREEKNGAIDNRTVNHNKDIKSGKFKSNKSLSQITADVNKTKGRKITLNKSIITKYPEILDGGEVGEGLKIIVREWNKRLSTPFGIKDTDENLFIGKTLQRLNQWINISGNDVVFEHLIQLINNLEELIHTRPDLLKYDLGAYINLPNLRDELIIYDIKSVNYVHEYLMKNDFAIKIKFDHLTITEMNFISSKVDEIGIDDFIDKLTLILQYRREDHTDKTEDEKRLVDLRYVLNEKMWNDNLTAINRDKYFLEWVRVEKAKARATANKESEERKQQRRIDEIIKNRADDIRYITKKIIPVYEQCGIDIDIDIDTDTDTEFDLSILPKKYVRWVATKLDAVSGYKHFEQGKDVQFILDSLTDIVTDMLSDERVRNKGGILSWELKNVGMWEKSYISKQ